MPGSSTSGRITDLFRSGRQEAIYEAIRTMALDRGIISEDTPETDVYSFLAGVSEHLEGFTRLQPSEVRGLLNTLRFHPRNLDSRNLYRLVTLLLALASSQSPTSVGAETSALPAPSAGRDTATVLEEGLAAVRRGIASDIVSAMLESRAEVLNAAQRLLTESRAEAAARQETVHNIGATLDAMHGLLNSILTRLEEPLGQRVETAAEATAEPMVPSQPLSPSTGQTQSTVRIEATKPVYQRIHPTDPASANRHRFMWTITGAEDPAVTYAGIAYRPAETALPAVPSTAAAVPIPENQVAVTRAGKPVEYIPESEAPSPPTPRQRGGRQTAPPVLVNDTGEDLLSVSEAGRIKGVAAETIRQWIRKGRLPATIIESEGQIRVRRTDLDQIERERAPRKSTSKE